MPILSLRSQLWALLACIAGVQASTRTIIVDNADTNQISYSNGWNPGDQCVGCAAQPDKRRARNGTWHDGTESADRLDEVYFTFVFTGTAVEVWYTAIDLIGPWTTNTNVTYSIDGIPRGEQQRPSTNRTDYLYNQSLFRVGELPNVEHVLRVDIQRPGVLLFDYLIYTEETIDLETTTSQSRFSSTSSPPPSSSPIISSEVKDVNIGAIVGGVVSGVLVLVIVSASYYCLKNRRKRERAHRLPIPVVIQDPPLHQPYIPEKLSRGAPHARPQDESAGAILPVSSQHHLPFHHNFHSRSAVPPKVTLTTALGTSQDPLMSGSVSHPLVPPWQGGLASSSNMNRAMLSSEDERAGREMSSRPYSPQSLPPPYTPNGV